MTRGRRGEVRIKIKHPFRQFKRPRLNLNFDERPRSLNVQNQQTSADARLCYHSSVDAIAVNLRIKDMINYSKSSFFSFFRFDQKAINIRQKGVAPICKLKTARNCQS